MKAGKEDNRLLGQTSQENTEGKEIEPSWSLGIERERKFLAEFYSHSPAVSTAMNQKNETSFLRTFGEAISAFGVFYLKMFELMIWPVKLLHHRGRKKLQ